MKLMNDTLELIANLWYLMDDDGFIYSLRARLYIMAGSDDEKLLFLKAHSQKDFLIAQPFPLPEKYKTNLYSSNSEGNIPIVSLSSINATGGPIVLFDEVFNILESQLPAQTQLSIPEEPLIVITPLAIDEKGELIPCFTKSMKL